MLPVKVLLRADTYDRLVQTAVAPECSDDRDRDEQVAEDVGAILETAWTATTIDVRLPPLAADLCAVEILVSKRSAADLLEEAGRAARRAKIRDANRLSAAQWHWTGHELEAALLAWEQERRTRSLAHFGVGDAI